MKNEQLTSRLKSARGVTFSEAMLFALDSEHNAEGQCGVAGTSLQEDEEGKVNR